MRSEECDKRLNVSPQPSMINPHHNLVLVLVRVIDNLAAEVIKTERNVKQVPKRFFDKALLFGPDEQQHESPATGAEQFAAESPGLQTRLVNGIDMAIGNIGGHILFDAPPLVQ